MSVFVTIDALDGVGKSTLVEGLARRLGGDAMATPGLPTEALRSDVLRGLGTNPDAHVAFYASTCIARGSEARQRASSGIPIVMDRYWLSTVAYGLARGCSAELRALVTHIPRPDLSIILTLDELERRRRLDNRGDLTSSDLETLDPAFACAVMLGLRDSVLWSTVQVSMDGLDREQAVERVAAAIADWRSAAGVLGGR